MIFKKLRLNILNSFLAIFSVQSFYFIFSEYSFVLETPFGIPFHIKPCSFISLARISIKSVELLLNLDHQNNLQSVNPRNEYKIYKSNFVANQPAPTL